MSIALPDGFKWVKEPDAAPAPQSTLTRPPAPEGFKWIDAGGGLAEPPSFTGAMAKGFKRSLPETKSLLAGAGAAVAGAVGLDGVRDKLLDTYQGIQQSEVAPLQAKTGFIDAVTGDGSLKEWAGDTLGNFGGQALQSVAAAGAGALLGSAVPGAGTAAGAVGGLVGREALKRGVSTGVGKMLTEKAATEAGRTSLARMGGAALAPTVLNIGQETGIAYTGRAEDAAAAGEELNTQDALRAMGYGTAAGLVDTGAEAFAAGKLLNGISASPSMLKRAAGGAGVGAVVEGGTEGAQAVLERMGAAREITGEEATRDYIENIAAGALGGGVMGAGGGLRRREDLAAPPQTSPPPVTPEVNASQAAPSPLATPLATPPAGPLTRAAATVSGAAPLATPPVDPAGATAQTPSAAVDPPLVADTAAQAPAQGDPVFDQAKQLIGAAGKVQRAKLAEKLGLNRNQTQTLLDQLQAAGIIGPANGTKARKLLVNPLTGAVVDPDEQARLDRKVERDAQQRALEEAARGGKPAAAIEAAAAAQGQQPEPTALSRPPMTPEFEAKMRERQAAALTRAQRPDPAAGATSAAAAVAFDTGAAAIAEQQAAQAAQEQQAQAAVSAQAEADKAQQQQQKLAEKAAKEADKAARQAEKDRVQAEKTAQAAALQTTDEDIRVAVQAEIDAGKPMDGMRMSALAAKLKVTPKRIDQERMAIAQGRKAATAAKESPSQGLAAAPSPETAARSPDLQTPAISAQTPSAGSVAEVAAPESPAPSGDSAYDTSADVLDDDITPPSGGAFSIRGAAESTAKRTPGGRVFEVDGGFVVRTPRAVVAQAATTAPDPAAAVYAAKDRDSYVSAVHTLVQSLPDGSTVTDEDTGVTYAIKHSTNEKTGARYVEFGVVGGKGENDVTFTTKADGSVKVSGDVYFPGKGKATIVPAAATGKESLQVAPAPTILPTSAERSAATIKESLTVAAAKPKAAIATDVAGEQLDDKWTAFAPETGTLNVPRAEMPQVKSEHRGAMVQYLAARGITHEQAEVPADSLKPTQAEFSAGKVKKALKRAAEGEDRAILVSADGHVLDGHHQWLAKREAGAPVKVIRLNAPIAELLTQVKEFPSSTNAGGAAASQTQQEQANAEQTQRTEQAPAARQAAEAAKPEALLSEKPAGGISPSALEAFLKPATEALRKDGVQIHVITTAQLGESTGDAAEDARREAMKRGMGNKKSRASVSGDRQHVYFFADKLKTIEEAARVAAHELVGHIGMERLLGGRWAELRAAVLRLRDAGKWPELFDEVRARYANNPDGTARGMDDDTFAAEAIAVFAERNVKTNILQAAMVAARGWLRRTFPNQEIEISQDELRQLVWEAGRMVKGKRFRSGVVEDVLGSTEPAAGTDVNPEDLARALKAAQVAEPEQAKPKGAMARKLMPRGDAVAEVQRQLKLTKKRATEIVSGIKSEAKNLDGVTYNLKPGIVQTADVQAAIERERAAKVTSEAAPMDARTEVTSTATHKDPGQPAEPVTAPVIAEAIATSASKTPLNLKEARAWLLERVDEALKGAVAQVEAWAKADIRPEYDRETKGLKLSKKEAEAVGFVTFDVPGDGKFKVLNTREGLQAFRAKVAASSGFKDERKASTRPSMPKSEAWTVINDFLEDDEHGNMFTYANAVDKPLRFGEGGNGTVTAYAVAEDVQIADGIKAFVGRAAYRGQLKQEKGKPLSLRGMWAVIEVTTGQSVGGFWPNRDAAIAASKRNIEKAGVGVLRDKIAKTAARTEKQREQDWLKAAAPDVYALMNGEVEQDAAPAPKTAKPQQQAARDENAKAGTKPVTPQMASANRLQTLISIAADSVDKLRKADVERVIREAPAEYRQILSEYIKTNRQDLAGEVDDVMAEEALRRGDFEAEDRMRKQQRAEKLRAAGDMSNGGTLRQGASERWAMVIPNMSEEGGWRIQRFDKQGFSGHMVFKTMDEAVNEAVQEGYTVRDDEALPRIQDDAAFKRGNHVSSLIYQLNAKQITTADFEKAVAEYDKSVEPAKAAEIPEGYKPTGEPYYVGKDLVQGYAKFPQGERVKLASGIQGVVTGHIGKGPILTRAMVKFDNGTESGVDERELSAVVSETATTETPRAPDQNANKKHSVAIAAVSTPAGALKADAYNSRSPSSVWWHQGDVNMIQFNAKAVLGETSSDRAREDQQKAKTEWARIKAARAAGWGLTNVRAGSYGTVWVFEKNDEYLTRAGFENIDNAVFARPDMPTNEAGYESMARRQITFAKAFMDWANTLPEDQRNNLSVLSRKINETPIHTWARIQEDSNNEKMLMLNEGSGWSTRIGLGRDADWSQSMRYLDAIASKAADIGKREGYVLMREAKTESGVVLDVAEKGRLGRERAAAAAAAPKAAAEPKDRIEGFKQAVRALHAGTLSVEDYRAAYEALRRGALETRADLAKLSKDELRNTFGIMRDGKKSELVDMAYEAMVNTFALRKEFGPRSYITVRGGFEDFQAKRAAALDELVRGQTAESLAEFAEQERSAREGRQKQRAEMVEAVKNPKTLSDFRAFLRYQEGEGKTFEQARMTLTLEQRVLFDELNAAEFRSQRKSAAEPVQAVKVAGQKVSAEVIATKHTQKGHDLYVVQLGERVPREDYDTLNATAKKLGGSWSSYNKGGAVPGFQFRERQSAEAFVKLANGDASAAQAAVDARRDAFQDDRSQTGVERLREMADRLEERADESLSRDRKANTDRRARMAASAEASANADKALARTMRNIADAIDNGSAKFLDRVRQKAQVEALAGYVSAGKSNELRAKYPRYADYERHQGEPPTQETADFAEFPRYTMYRSDLAALARQLVENDGTKKMGASLLKLADDTSDAFAEFVKEPGNYLKLSTFTVGSGERPKFPTAADAEAAIRRSGHRGKAIAWQVKRGDHTVIMSPSEAIARGIWKGDGDKRITLNPNFGAELVEAIGKTKRRGAKVAVPWQFETAYDRRKALSRLGIETAPEFRVALREFIALREQPATPDRVKVLERAMVGRVNDGLDFFPTPAEVADQMIAAAGIEPGMRVFEPSAGMGHIAERIRKAGAEPDVGEISGARKELLEAKGFNVVAGDFLAFDDANQADRGYTYGDVFRAPDGTLGVLRGSAGMGSDRVGLDPLDENGVPDMRRSRWETFGDLVPVEKRGVGSGYDRIVMNPPFSDGRDIQHVRHAYSLLKPGGRVVALMGESAFTNQNKRATEFRAWLESVGGTEEKLPDGSFMDPSLPVNTGANARMVVIEKQTPPASFAKSGEPQRFSPATARAWQALAEIPGTFQRPRTDAKSFEDITKAILPDAEVVEVDDGATITVQPMKDDEGKPLGKPKAVTMTILDGELAMDASQLEEGVHRGSALYSIALTYAHNNGVVFIPDPADVSEAAMQRRGEHMLSSALKFGTTRHMVPDPEQGLDWRDGDDQHNVLELVRASADNVIDNVPDLQAVDYDWDSGQFIAASGKPFTLDDFKALAESPAGRAARAGVSTLRRGVVSRSLERRAGSPAWRGVVTRLLQLGRAGLRGSQLEGILYARGADGARGMTAEKLTRLLAAAKQAMALVGVDIEVVANGSDLPAEITAQDDYDDTVQAAITGDRKTVYFVASRIASPRAAMKLVAHELVGHMSMEQLLGKRWPELRAAILRLRDNGKWPEVFAEVSRRYERNADGTFRALDDATFAAEAIAVFAERNIRTSILQRAINGVRAWLRRLGFAMDMSQGELRQMLWEAGQKLEGRAYRAAVVDDVLGAKPEPKQMSMREAVERYSFGKGGSETIDVDGVDRPTTDSTGKPIHPTEEGLRNFWRWFGDSKVVDGQGRPLVVYHGTRADVAAFDASKTGSGAGHTTSSTGVFFSADPVVAGDFPAVKWGGWPLKREMLPGQNIVPAYLSIPNPMEVSAAEFQKDWVRSRRDGLELRASASAAGHDGVRITADQSLAERMGGEEYGADAFVAFDPAQIKSAIGNTGAFSPTDARVNFAKAGTIVDRLQEAISPKDTTLLQRIKDKLSDWRPAALGALQLRHLGELAERILPPVAQYSGVVQRMATMRNELQELGHAVVEAGMKYQGANPKESKRLFRLLHDATLAGVDPSKGHQALRMMAADYRTNVEVSDESVRAFVKLMNEQAKLNPGSAVSYVNRAKEARKLLSQERKRRVSHRELAPAFAQLSDDGKALWAQMRDAYAAQSDEYQKALISRIESLSFDKAKKAGQIARMRLQFESARVPFYVPLARWGEYWVSGTNSEGQREFFMQESQGDQNRVKRELEKMGYLDIGAGVKLDTVQAQDGASASFMADMDQMLAESGAPEKIRDEAFQLYLRSLPDLSMRKNFIHRQGTPGFSQDAVRALAGHIFHGSFQIARLRYSHELEGLRNDAEAMVKDMGKAGDPNAVAAGNIVNELKERHKWVMNPQDNALVNKISSIGFVYYLGLTPAAALVNLLQTPMVALPILAGKHKLGAATRELTRAMKESLGTYGNMQSKLAGDELEAHKEFARRGVFDKTQAHNMAGISESDTHAYSPAWHKAMTVISHVFHKAEVVNREATAMAAYRLERAAGAGHVEAVEAADRAVHESQFDYSNANRARFMQSGTAKVLLMFRQYSLAVTWLLGRNLYQAFKGEDAATKKEAKRKLAGILGMTAIFSGTLGLPIIGTVGAVLNAVAAAFGDDDEPWDWETEFRAFLREMLGETGAEAVLRGPVQAATGVGIASRVSMGDLWFREPDRELEGRAWSNYLFEQAAGPMGGLITNFFRGQQLMGEGHVWRGVETMMPKALKDAMKSLRYLDEGVNNMRGDPIVEDLNVFESLAQIAGFAPASVANAYDTARDVKNYEQAILNRRSRLMDAFALAWRLGDVEAREAVLGKMRKFSQTYPELAITGDSIRRSLMQRAKASTQADNGVIIDKRIRARLEGQLGM